VVGRVTALAVQFTGHIAHTGDSPSGTSSTRLTHLNTYTGDSPSGKAAAFGAAIRGFESLIPSQSE
jgi:hypothetical protein